jgi:uncharacterized protein YjbI with pentapeptide repeats
VTDFVCDIHPAMRSACEGLSFYAEHEGKRYCVLHFPGEEKQDKFTEVLKSKVAQNDFDFSGTIFPESTADFAEFGFDADASFEGATFVGDASFKEAQFKGDIDFSVATFSGESTTFANAQFSGETYFATAKFIGGRTSFEEAQFSNGVSFALARFSGGSTNFRAAQFNGKWIDFDKAQFRDETTFRAAEFKGETFFGEAQFKGERTDFSYVEFGGSETIFEKSTFANDANFREATFRERIAFRGTNKNPIFGSQAWASFDHSRIEKPEQFTFHSVLLHPGWFTNVDVRKVDFTDVKWYGMPSGPRGTLNEEIDVLEQRGVESPYTLLSQACQRLAANAEENRDYPLANDFYYWSMDALRKAGWRRLGLIRALYWVLSGYGVKPGHAFGVLVLIWLVFAAFYVLVPSSEFYAIPPSNPGRVINDAGQAVVYSLGAMARLNPEPKPDPGWFQFLVTVEGLLGPLQIGLLLLAIRRKVMR